MSGPEALEKTKSRNLVICCDGTNNEFGVNNTNVVRLIQALNRDPAKQRLHYDPGVGTLPEIGRVTRLGKWLSKVRGLAFGAGLSANIEEAYSYLMDFWEPGDKVFLFGFSRGAYSVRVLAALLHALGLMPRGSQNLLPYAMRLFKGSKGRRDDKDYWKLLNHFRRTFARQIKPGEDDRRFPVHFLGVWDTVSSVGWLWNPVTYPFTRTNPSVDVIRHAVSVDERRCFFRQNQMVQAKRKPGEPQQDLKELWFPGVHCDIGGGYPLSEGGLWQEPFRWMVTEAQAAGLELNEPQLHTILKRSPVSPPWWAANSWIDDKHESLTWQWWLAEFFPKLERRRTQDGAGSWTYASRKTPKLGLFGHREIDDGAMIHSSTLRRIRELNTYKPRNLSNSFVATVRGLKDVPDDLPYKK